VTGNAARVLKLATYCCFVLCLAGCWYASTTADMGSTDADSVSAVEDEIRAIAFHWDKSVFDASVAPNFYHQVKKADVDAFLTRLRTKLGGLKSIKLLKSDEKLTQGTAGETDAADFLFDATFAKGRGQISATMVNVDGGWLVENLHIDSPALTP
jgi:hypothetical protein